MAWAKVSCLGHPSPANTSLAPDTVTAPAISARPASSTVPKRDGATPATCSPGLRIRTPATSLSSTSGVLP